MAGYGHAICIRDNLHLCAANWPDRDGRKKRSTARARAYSAPAGENTYEKRNGETKFRGTRRLAALAECTFVYARCAVLKLRSARARAHLSRGFHDAASAEWHP